MLADHGWVITRADTNIKWPGDAAVTVALVHMQHGDTLDRPHADLWAELCGGATAETSLTG